MKAIGLRIKEARLAKNLKQEELAKSIGEKSGATVSAWEVGKAKPDCVTLLRICEILNTSPDELLGYHSDTPTSSELSMIRKYRYMDEYGKKIVNSALEIEYERALSNQHKKYKTRRIELDYYPLSASAGTGSFLDDETPEKIWVTDTPVAENADYIIPISGDSMEPSFHDGDKVFVEKADHIEEGDIGIFVVNGDAFIKELGNKCLISHNNAYKPIKLLADDNVFCCGKVLGVAEE